MGAEYSQPEFVKGVSAEMRGGSDQQHGKPQQFTKHAKRKTGRENVVPSVVVVGAGFDQETWMAVIQFLGCGQHLYVEIVKAGFTLKGPQVSPFDDAAVAAVGCRDRLPTDRSELASSQWIMFVTFRAGSVGERNLDREIGSTLTLKSPVRRWPGARLTGTSTGTNVRVFTQ